VSNCWRGGPLEDEKHKRYVHANRGSVQVLPVPDAPQPGELHIAVGRTTTCVYGRK